MTASGGVAVLMVPVALVILWATGNLWVLWAMIGVVILLLTVARIAHGKWFA